MKINRKDLQNALIIVKPGLSNKDILEQTTSFAFINGRVTTYNDEISISHPVKGINFEGAIKAEELYGLLTRLNKDEIELGVDNNELQIRCGRVKAGLQLEDEIQLPDVLPKGKWKKLPNPNQFKDYMIMAMQTCSTDMAEVKLTCVCVRKDGGIIGSDNYRVVQCTGSKSPVADYLIPATSISELVKINPVQIQLEKNWVHFKSENDTIFSCRRVNVEYLEQELINDIIKFNKKGKIEFPDKIEEMLQRVGEFAKRQIVTDSNVEVSIQNGKLLMRAVADQTKSWIEDKSSIECDKNISFMITPKLFENILKVTRTCVLDKKMEKVKFVMESENINWEYVVMLSAV